MSNSVAKKARRRSNIFENDYEDLIYSSEPLKTKNIPSTKPKKEKHNNIHKTDSQETKQLFSESISTVPVKCTCNKCGTTVEGKLVGIIYCSISGLNTPFVSYSCPSCNHIGKRSVGTKALPTDQFDRLYF